MHRFKNIKVAAEELGISRVHFYRLLKACERNTGCPVMVNTSFNIRGEPMVCTPEDAYRCFMATDMDALVLGDHLLLKESMKHTLTQSERDRYLAGFAPD